MPPIQVRNVPEPIYRKLAAQAAKEGRSLAQQTLHVLARGLGVDDDAKSRRKSVLAEIAGLDGANTRKLSDPVKLIREDRSR